MFERKFPLTRRDPFGRIDEEADFAFRDIRNRPFEQHFTELGKLDDNVGRDQRNNRRDVAKVETLLARDKRFDIDRTDGPTGIFSTGLEDTIKGFQKDKGLKQDGLITPRGETISSMIQLSDSDGGNGGGEGDDNDGGKMPQEPDQQPPKEPEDDQKPDEPKEPKDSDNSDETDCRDLEVALANAESILEQAQSELAAAEEEIAGEKAKLESQLSDAQQELDAMIAAQKPTGIAVTGIGGIGGAIGGGIIGSMPGPGGTIPGAIAGGRAGLEVAERAIEGIELQIELKKQEIADIQEKIDTLLDRLDPFQAAVFKAETLVSDAQNALKECMASQEG